MTISEDDDNLIKCNKIPCESAMSESLAHLTRSHSETNRICTVDICSYRNGNKKDLTGNKKNAFFLCLCKNLTKREKHDKLLQTDPVTLSKKVGRTIPLHATVYKK